MNDGGPAFPTVFDPGSTLPAAEGMSLRDYFAGQCAHAAIELASVRPSAINLNVAATVAYQMADALIAEREKRNTPETTAPYEDRSWLPPEWKVIPGDPVTPPPSHPDNPTLKK